MTNPGILPKDYKIHNTENMSIETYALWTTVSNTKSIKQAQGILDTNEDTKITFQNDIEANTNDEMTVEQRSQILKLFLYQCDKCDSIKPLGYIIEVPAKGV